MTAEAAAAAPAAPAHPVQYESRRAARAATDSAPAVAPAPAAVPVVPAFSWATSPSASAEAAAEAAADAQPSATPFPSSTTRREVTAAAPRRSLRQRLTAAGTMVLVGGLFVSLSLPAYAGSSVGDFEGVSENSAVAHAAIGAQALNIDLEAAAASQIEARDTYEAVTPAQLRTMFREGLREQNMSAYATSGARELGDDYPWYAELTRGQGGGLSPLNYYYRECVDFVAWRLNRDAGSVRAPFVYNWSNLTPGAGSARSWKKQWEKHGWEVSATPSPGWVAWFPGGNHVAYVNAVLADGSVLLEEYNWGPHLYGQRIIPASDALYLAPPPR